LLFQFLLCKDLRVVWFYYLHNLRHGNFSHIGQWLFEMEGWQTLDVLYALAQRENFVLEYFIAYFCWEGLSTAGR